MLQVLYMSSFELILCIVITHLENNSTTWKVSMVIFKISVFQKLSMLPFICKKQKTTATGVDRNAECSAVAQTSGFVKLLLVHHLRRRCADFVELDLFHWLKVHLKLHVTHTVLSIWLHIHMYNLYIYIHHSQVQYIFWNNLPTKPATRFGSCVSSAGPDSSCSVLDDRVPSAVVLFTCTIQSNLYKFSKHKCSKHHHLGSQQ